MAVVLVAVGVANVVGSLQTGIVAIVQAAPIPPHWHAPPTHLFASAPQVTPPHWQVPALQVNPVSQVTLAHGSENEHLMKFLI